MTAVAAPTHRREGGDSAARRGLWAPFASLMSGQGIAAALGVVFWVLVARVAEPSAVGLATAAISTQTLLGLLVSLGLGTHLVTVLPTAGPEVVRRWVSRSLAGAGLVGLAVSGLVVAVVEGSRALGADVGGALVEGLTDPLMVVGFVVGVVAATGVLVLDEAVLGLRRSRVQLTRNVTASLLRFPVGALLLLLVGADPWAVQATWVLPLLVSLLLALRSLRLPPARPAPWSDDLREHLRPALRHYAVNMAVASASQVIPVVGAVALVATDNAAFAVAWLLATAAFLPPYMLTTALYAHASHDGAGEQEVDDDALTGQLAAHLRRTVPVALALVLLAWAGAALLGEQALGLLGGHYAEESAHLLVLLVPAGLWAVVKDHLVVVWRRRRHYRLAAGVAAVTLVAETLGAVAGAVIDGATGLVAGWLAVTVIELVVGTPVLLRHMQIVRTVRTGAGRRRRDERGQAAWSLVALLTVSALVAVGVIVVLAATGTSDSDDPAQDELVGTAACAPSPERPGPELDLTVKVDTGDATDPYRSEEEVEALVGAADEAGADVISTSLSWRVAQPRRDAGYDFRGLDRVIAAAEERGLEVKVQLLHMTFWAFDGGSAKYGPWAPPRTESELARWRSFVGDVTEHLDGRARYVEIWSNPDSARYWRTGPDPAQYARMLLVSAAAVKEVDPGVQVVSGGVDGDGAYLGALLDEFDGGQPPLDLLGLHVYGDADAMLDPRALYGRVVDDLDDRGLDVPIYITELGFSTDVVPDDVRAERTEVTLDAMNCDPDIDVVSWYALHPSRWDAPSWALLDDDAAPTLTYEALRDWSVRRQVALQEAR